MAEDEAGLELGSECLAWKENEKKHNLQILSNQIETPELACTKVSRAKEWKS